MTDQPTTPPTPSNQTIDIRKFCIDQAIRLFPNAVDSKDLVKVAGLFEKFIVGTA